MQRMSEVNGRALKASSGRLQFAAILLFGESKDAVLRDLQFRSIGNIGLRHRAELTS